MVEHASVVRVTYFHPADGKREDVLAALRQVAETARTAEGSFGAQPCTAQDEPEAVVVVSRWRSEADMEAYFVQHGAGINASVGPLCAAPPRSLLFTSLSD